MRKQILVAAIASVLMILALRWQGASLVTPESPRGMIDFEFANTFQQVNQLLELWDDSIVKLNIWLDFIFIASYILFLSLASGYCAFKWGSGLLWWMGNLFVRLAFIAGLLDIAENLLMLQTLAGNMSAISLQLTFYLAAIKFILAGLILLYLLISLPVVIRRK